MGAPRAPGLAGPERIIHTMNTPATRETLLEIHRRLVEVYGAQPHAARKGPLEELVNTILSQNTNDTHRDVAYRRLRDRFPTWEAVRDAPVEALVEAIRPAGLAPSKAPRIQQALRRITEEQGALTLDFLADLPLEEARRWLLSLEGVGPKTAAIVLLFSLDKPAFPVDTHIYRVTRRLGLLPPQVSREQAHTLLETAIPAPLYYPLHLNLIEHGRQVCQARRPHCERCALAELCAYYQKEIAP